MVTEKQSLVVESLVCGVRATGMEISLDVLYHLGQRLMRLRIRLPTRASPVLEVGCVNPYLLRLNARTGK